MPRSWRWQPSTAADTPEEAAAQEKLHAEIPLSGVFAIASGWGAAGTVIASVDGENWRHLTDGNAAPNALRKPGSRAGDRPRGQSPVLSWPR